MIQRPSVSSPSTTHTARTARGKAAPEGDDNDALPLQQLAASQHTSPHGDGDAAPTSPPPATGDGGGRAAEGDDGWEPDRNSPPRQQKIPIANGGVDGEADVHHGDGDGDPEEDVDVAVKTQADDTQQALDAPEPVQMDDTKETIKHDTNDTRSPPASTHACDTHPPSSATQPQEKDATTDAATPAAAGATPQKITPQKNVKWGKRARGVWWFLVVAVGCCTHVRVYRSPLIVQFCAMVLFSCTQPHMLLILHALHTPTHALLTPKTPTQMPPAHAHMKFLTCPHRHPHKKTHHQQQRQPRPPPPQQQERLLRP